MDELAVVVRLDVLDFEDVSVALEGDGRFVVDSLLERSFVVVLYFGGRPLFLLGLLFNMLLID